MPEIPCNESFVPNTRMAIYENSSGRQTQYRFYPNEGYVMHVKSVDTEIYDETGVNVIGYTELFGSGTKSVPISYDFSVVVQDVYTYTDENGNTQIVPIEKIGVEELYTLPESIVPQNQLYGGDNNHEVASTQPETEPAEQTPETEPAPITE